MGSERIGSKGSEWMWERARDNRRSKERVG